MTVAAALIWCWMFSIGAQTTSSPAQGVPGSGTREAFLKTIARPRVPLDATARQRQEPGDAIVEEISFAAEASERVPGLLFKPRGAERRRPAVVVLHGTGGSKEGMAGRLRALAARGFVAVAIDGRYHGARIGSGSDGMPAYQSAILRAYRTGREHPFLFDTVWDVMRLIDYLETRADVDARRIGLTGISKGGMEGYLAAAVDPRAAVAAREYKAQGVPDRLVLQLQPESGHQVTAEADRAMLAWFERWLAPEIERP